MIFFTVFVFLLYTSLWIKPNNVYANNLELVGKENGLVVLPSDNKLFDINNLNPGDNITATLKIRNEDKYPFTLFMKTESEGNSIGESQGDIYKKLVLKIYYKNEKIYDGPMNGFGNEGISLGKFYPGTEEKIVASVNLPGPETGNEYQGKSVKVKWIFIAQSSGKDKNDDHDHDHHHDDPKENPDIPHNNSPGEDIDIPDNNPPGGEIDVPNNNKPEENTNIPDNTVPGEQIKPKMPKTGEVSYFIYYSTGSILVLSGIVFLFKKKKD